MLDINANALWFSKAAHRAGLRTGKTGVEVLEEVQDNLFSAEISTGKLLVSNAEGGASQTYITIPQASPTDIARLCEAAIALLNANGGAPATSGRPTRAVVSFRNASI